MEYNEKLLIQRAASGDVEAFNELLSKHESRIYAVTLRIMRNKQDAEDCMVDAMTRIFTNIGSFKGESAFSTWVYRIATNTCLDELRRRKNVQLVSQDVLIEKGWAPVDHSPTPEQQALSSELRGELNQLIDELPEDIRTAVRLRDTNGLTYEEIASIQNVNIGTVKSRISRGREKLRAKIKQLPELFDLSFV